MVTLKNTPLNSSNNSENQGFENINNLDGSVDYRNEEVEQAWKRKMASLPIFFVKMFYNYLWMQKLHKTYFNTSLGRHEQT